jgi:arylesterase/paraoxonase
VRIFFLSLLAATLALAAYLASVVVPASGAFQTFEPKLAEACRKVEVYPGTEDVAIDPETGLAYVAAGDHRRRFEGEAAAGGIYIFHIDKPEAAAKASPELADFHPHGISLWRGEKGEKRLFVVSHASTGEKVEIFDIGPDALLTHKETIAFPEMTSPNDVHAVGPRQFYVTNDRGYQKGLMATIEGYFALPFSSLAYFDGEKGAIAAKNLVYANGVNQSPDGKSIYVSELLKRRVAVFERTAGSGALAFKRRLKVNTNPDNIDVAKDGALFIGGHPKVLEFLKHVDDPVHHAPSHVIWVDPRSGATTDVLYDAGAALDASSVGAVSDTTLIVGSVFGSHVLVCPLGAAEGA